MTFLGPLPPLTTDQVASDGPRLPSPGSGGQKSEICFPLPKSKCRLSPFLTEAPVGSSASLPFPPPQGHCLPHSTFTGHPPPFYLLPSLF